MSELDVEALDLSKPPKRKVADPIICKYSGRTLGSLEELKMWHQVRLVRSGTTIALTHSVAGSGACSLPVLPPPK
jgi:hypothetical protein